MSLHNHSDTNTGAAIQNHSLNEHNPFFSSVDDGSSSDGGKDNLKLPGEDPLGTQVRKLFARHKYSLPSAQRMENLTWRMMALALRKRREREAEAISSSSRPLTETTDDISNGPGDGRDKDTQAEFIKALQLQNEEEHQFKPLTIQRRDPGVSKKTDEDDERGRRADRGQKPKMRVEGFHTAAVGSETMDWRPVSRSRSRTPIGVEWRQTTHSRSRSRPPPLLDPSGASLLSKSLMMFSECPPSAGIEFYSGHFSQTTAQERPKQDARFVLPPKLGECFPSSSPAYHPQPRGKSQTGVHHYHNAEWHAGIRGPLPDEFPRRVRKSSFDHTVKIVKDDMRLRGRHQVNGRPMAPPETIANMELQLHTFLPHPLYPSSSSHTNSTSIESPSLSSGSSLNFGLSSSDRCLNGDSIRRPYIEGDRPDVGFDPTVEIASAAAAAAIEESVARFAITGSTGAFEPGGSLENACNSIGMRMDINSMNSGIFSPPGGYGGEMTSHNYDHPIGTHSPSLSTHAIDLTQDLSSTGILGHRGSIDNLHKWAIAAASAAASMHEKENTDLGFSLTTSSRPGSRSGSNHERASTSRVGGQRKTRLGAGSARRTSTGTIAAAGGIHTRKKSTGGVSITLPSFADKKPSAPEASTSILTPLYYEAIPGLQPEDSHQRSAILNKGPSEHPTSIAKDFNDSADKDAASIYPILYETMPLVYSDDVPDLTDQIVKIGTRAIFDGTYSTVYRGYLDQQEVAIKVIRGVKHIRAMRRKFRREVYTWWHFSHPNILPLLGFAEGDEYGAFGAMVSPWCHNGNAADYTAQGLNMANRVQLFRDVAEGLYYLHNLNPVVVHGDLKPANVLINRDGVAQLCDFGLVRLVHDQMATGLTTTTAHTGTARYLSLELVEADEESIPTTASDIYALGCIGMEFIYSQAPYCYIQTNQPNAHFKICRDISEGIPPARRPDIFDPIISVLWDILEGCWEPNPGNRPDANHLRDYLNQEAHNLTAALNV